MNTLAILLGFGGAIYIAIWAFDTVGNDLLGYVCLGLALLCIPLGFFAVAADYQIIQGLRRRDDEDYY